MSEKGRTSFGLGAWNVYFLAKLALYFRHEIGLHPVENLAFATFLLMPVSSRFWQRARNMVSVPVAVALLYYDSWLPPFSRALSEAHLIYKFTIPYLVELIGRFVSLSTVALLILAFAAYRVIASRVKVGVLVMGVLAFLTFSQNKAALSPPGPAMQSVAGAQDIKARLDEAVRSFFAREATRSVSFPQASGMPFDIIFIHVCSLAWDDVRAVGLDNHPIWKQFDILFTNFNSASTYSGPAAIRVLRSTCGQQTHSELYSPVPGRCYVMDSLKDAGFAPNLVLNHDGHFDGFLKTVQAQGVMNMTPMPREGIKVDQHAFDDSPVYDDLGVLSRWLDERKKNDVTRVVVYYNTISLHDGNHMLGQYAGKTSMETYKVRLNTLLDELNAFMEKVAESKRRVVLVMVPEHGAAYRGDRMQIPGLREIPTPAITIIPVGIKVVGADIRRNGETLKIDTPSSFLAMTSVISKMLAKSPYDSGGFSPADYANDLPETDFVAENENMLMLRMDNRYYLRQQPDDWSEYTP